MAWRGSLYRGLRRLLSLEDSPERIAFAFAIGVFFAFSPLLGLHTFLGLCVAFCFGLNRVAVLVGVFVNNPWTLVPIYAAATYVGGIVVGFPAAAALPDFGWSELWRSTFWVQLGQQWRLLLPMVVGSLILSVLAAVLSYPLALYLIHKGRQFDTR
jgi:uncharacterized protein (DUF2062 family)